MSNLTTPLASPNVGNGTYNDDNINYGNFADGEETYYNIAEQVRDEDGNFYNHGIVAMRYVILLFLILQIVVELHDNDDDDEPLETRTTVEKIAFCFLVPMALASICTALHRKKTMPRSAVPSSTLLIFYIACFTVADILIVAYRQAMAACVVMGLGLVVAVGVTVTHYYYNRAEVQRLHAEWYTRSS